jgi:diguanylate cyclase
MCFVAKGAKLKTTKPHGNLVNGSHGERKRREPIVKANASHSQLTTQVVARPKAIHNKSVTHDSIALALAAAEARIAELESALNEADEFASRDPLTGVFNRRGMVEIFARESSRAQRGGQPFALALIDLDDFKSVNDNYGHAAGDAALAHLTSVIAQTLRPTDLCCRWGGEEFVVIMPSADRTSAKRALARVQAAISAQPVTGTTVTLAFSAGVVLSHGNESLENLLALADHAVYSAKAAGKRRIFIG